MSELNTIKFTLGELKTIEEPLKKIINLQLPIKISYKLSKILAKISKELALLEEQRMNLVRKYGTTNEETNEIRVMPDRMKEFHDEFSELLQEEIEFNFAPIDVNTVGNLQLSPLDMVQLEKFFTEE